MTAKEKLMPPLVLTLICAAVSALLTAAYNLTYVDDTGIITEKLAGGLNELYGTSEGFIILTDKSYDGVKAVIDNNSGLIAFEVISDGYNKEGLHLLIGFDGQGEVCGISVLSVSETPGLGTRVTDKSFLDRFKGISSADFSVDGITGATYSSEGARKAVRAAAQAYEQLKGEGYIDG